MSNDGINRITIAGTGALALIVFGGLCVRHNAPAIEAELSARAKAGLHEQRMGWAKVEVDGRDLALSGVAPDERARATALRIASVYGVRRVEDNLRTMAQLVDAEPAVAGPQPEPGPATETIAPPPAAPFRTRLTVNDGRLVLEGDVADDAARRRLVSRAQESFGVAAVEARMQTRSDAPADWERAVATSLQIADRLVLGEILIEPGQVSVTGLTATDAGDAFVRETLAGSLPSSFVASVETGSRRELDAVLRTSPALAQRLATRDRRDASTGATPSDAEPVLGVADCERQFRQRQADTRIGFDTASATLTAASRDLLDRLALVLKRCPAVRVAIEGHTDDQGLRENNLALSQRRAEEVMVYLVGRGIGLGRLSARGFGEERPLVANETAADRARNRRIEFVFEN